MAPADQGAIDAARLALLGLTPPRAARRPVTASHGLGELLTSGIVEASEDELKARSDVSVGSGDADWEDMTAQMMQASCAFFAQEILSGSPEPPYNGRFLVADHHLEWDQLLHDYRRLCVLAPRDHGKTWFFDFAYPIWKAYHLPRGRGYIFSATKPQAEEILADIKLEIETNPKLQHLLPADRKAKWSSSTIELANGHKIYAKGYGSKVRGRHPSWIVLDDVLNDESAYSETVRQKQVDYFFNAIRPMLSPTGQIIVVGTPFHEADLYAHLADNERYTFRKYQAIRKDGTALWPDRYTLEDLRGLQIEMGTIRFGREYMCEPINDEMSLFPSYLFRGDPVEQPTVCLGAPLKFWEEEVGIRSVAMGVDFAISSSVSADWTVIWIMGLDARGNRWIMDIQREHGMEYRAQKSLIIERARLYQPGLIFLESNQMQQIFGQTLITDTDLPIKPFVTGAQKNTLDKGVPSLRVLLENRKFRIPRGDEHSVELTNRWRDEMKAFTFVDGKLQGVGTHDDTVMACWICDQALKLGAFSFTFGDEAELEDGEEEEALVGEGWADDPEEDIAGLPTTVQTGNGKGNGLDGRATQNLIDEGAPGVGLPYWSVSG